MGSELFGQGFVVDSHVIAISRTTRGRGNRDPRESSSRIVALLGQAGDDPNGSVMLVKGVGQLVTCLRQLLLEAERVESQGIPFVLEGGKEGGDRCQGRGSGLDDAGGFDGQEVLEVEFVTGDGVLAVLLDVLLDEALLEDGACLLGNDWLLGSLTGDC